MQIGIGLPNPVLEVPGRLLVDWARRAEERGFSSVATIDRIAYSSYDSLTTLTAAAAVTDRIGLLTNVLLEPLYNPVLLAKVTASLDQLSGGRLTLGLGVGARPDDFQLAGRSFSDRAGGSTPTWSCCTRPGRASRWPAASSRSARRPARAASRC
jgi:alkanesulfonate monooxygenase SsuD/methylene tetrahydromethanopterin reductase-like flavin-dependent oxidoreductase (luciferase family)